MSLLAILVQAVQSLRLPRGARRPRKSTGIGLEQLDHRQLLAVNFTGNVLNDFNVTQTPAVYLSDPNNKVPLIPSNLAGIVHVSGFQINNIALNYDQATDTLSVGFLQPNSGINAFPVIAGDADDNGNNSTVSPAAAAQNVGDDPAISQGEHMFAVLDLSNGANTANESIFAGIPEADGTPGYPNATYVVAPAVFPGGNTELGPDPKPGAELTANEGNVFVPFNDPRHGALEFAITHFSQLYQQVTGQPLNGMTQIRAAAFAGSLDDDGIDEEAFHFQPLSIPQATTPIPPPPPPGPPPPPVIVELFQPTILINPHQNRHINTAHFDNIRVTVLSSASFDSRTIDPSTVRFGGATPIASFSKIQLHDGLYSTTFVFKGTDVNLPGGFTVAPITGQTFTGIQFTGAELVFNKNDSFYSQQQIDARDARLSRLGINVAQENGAAAQAAAFNSAMAAQAGAAGLTAGAADPAPTVKLTPRQQALANAQARRAALLSTAAAKFTGTASAPNRPVAQASAASAALLAHDLALQSLSSGSGQSAG